MDRWTLGARIMDCAREPTCKHWFNGNQIPYSPDSTEAFHRRWLLIDWFERARDERPMSLKELVEHTKVQQKQVYRVISSLHRSNQIVQFRDPDGVRRYKLSEESLRIS